VRGIQSDLATGLPDGRPPDGSYAHFGIVPMNVSRVVFPRRHGKPIVAGLSKRSLKLRWSNLELRKQPRRARRRLGRLDGAMRVRLFMAVMPAGTRDPLPVLHFAGGRRTRPYHR
jgi:hypothetical protein